MIDTDSSLKSGNFYDNLSGLILHASATCSELPSNVNFMFIYSLLPKDKKRLASDYFRLFIFFLNIVFIIGYLWFIPEISVKALVQYCQCDTNTNDGCYQIDQFLHQHLLSDGISSCIMKQTYIPFESFFHSK